MSALLGASRLRFTVHGISDSGSVALVESDRTERGV